MLLSLLLAYLAMCSGQVPDNEEYLIPSCSDGGAGMTFEPVEGVTGRYTAKYCAQPNQITNEWDLELFYTNKWDFCNQTALDKSGWTQHSKDVEWVSEHNCTNGQTACLSANFDLIFGACYALGSTFLGSSKQRYNFYFNITNNYTKQFFHNNTVIVDPPEFTENDTTITWHTGIPITIYSMLLCNDTYMKDCRSVEQLCVQESLTSLRCVLRMPLGCYTLELTHVAPWVVGVFSNQQTTSHSFCRTASPPVSVPSSGWSGVALGGAAGAALLAAAALTARALCRRNARLKLKQKVQASWLNNSTRKDDSAGPMVGGAEVTERDVLLLYAREGPRAAAATAALLQLLRESVSGEVWDIHSPAVTALAASAPAGWLRATLARPNTAVVLLQSPALHAVYEDTLTPDHKVCGALLGRAVAARLPSFGDVLLAAALRHVAEMPRSQDNYNKYYIACISGLPTEVMPCVVPYRRYELPAAAALLVTHLSPRAAPPAPAPSLAPLRRALAEFVDHARENPDYLLDELVPLDE